MTTFFFALNRIDGEATGRGVKNGKGLKVLGNVSVHAEKVVERREVWRGVRGRSRGGAWMDEGEERRGEEKTGESLYNFQ